MNELRPAARDQGRAGAPRSSGLWRLMRASRLSRRRMTAASPRSRRRMTADVVTEEKVERIDRAVAEHKSRLDEIAIKGRRPLLAAARRMPLRGERAQAGLRRLYAQGRGGGPGRLEAKALSAGTGPDGGYLVPDETETEIGRLPAQASPMRAIAGVRHDLGGRLQEAFRDRPAQRPAGSARRRRGRRPPPRRLPNCSFRPWRSTPCRRRRRRCSTTPPSTSTGGSPTRCRRPSPSRRARPSSSGDGITKPRGFLDYTKVATRLGLGQSRLRRDRRRRGALRPPTPADVLIDLVYALKAGYRQDASWVMTARRRAPSASSRMPTATISGSRRRGGAQAIVLGFPIVEAEDMPAIAPDAFPLAFGDFRRGYLIVDRFGMRVLRDPYRQALRALLHDEACRRRRAELRGDQASEVRRLIGRPST